MAHLTALLGDRRTAVIRNERSAIRVQGEEAILSFGANGSGVMGPTPSIRKTLQHAAPQGGTLRLHSTHKGVAAIASIRAAPTGFEKK